MESKSYGTLKAIDKSLNIGAEGARIGAEGFSNIVAYGAAGVLGTLDLSRIFITGKLGLPEKQPDKTATQKDVEKSEAKIIDMYKEDNKAKQAKLEKLMKELKSAA